MQKINKKKEKEMSRLSEVCDVKAHCNTMMRNETLK